MVSEVKHIIVADIGGTKAHLALYALSGDQPLEMSSHILSSRDLLRTVFLSTHDYDGISELLQTFISNQRLNLLNCSIAIAGSIVGDRIITPNIPWQTSISRVKAVTGIEKIHFLNDLQAIAKGVLWQRDDQKLILNPAGVTDEELACSQQTIGVIAVGTGIGEALLLKHEDRWLTIATEGGNTDFAATCPEEIELVEYLWKQVDHVSNEVILSGSGLYRIYRYLESTGRYEISGKLKQRLLESDQDPAVLISEYADHYHEKICLDTIDRFMQIYGSEAGNLALNGLTLRGIYVAGGVTQKLVGHIQNGSFLRRFVNKGVYSDLLKKIPVYVITNPDIAIDGAFVHSLENI